MAADCLFCNIVAGDVPAVVVRDGPRTLTFRDVNPQAATHVLVIPKEHYDDLASLAGADAGLLAEVFGEAAAVAVEEGLSGAGYRVVVNSGRDGGQSVPHLHAHVLGGRPLGWPPG